MTLTEKGGRNGNEIVTSPEYVPSTLSDTVIRPHTLEFQPRPEVIKKFFMLNSAEHEILNAHKSKNIKKFSIFSGSNKHRMLFFLLIKAEMPTVVGISTFISRKITCSRKKFYNLGAWNQTLRNTKG